MYFYICLQNIRKYAFFYYLCIGIGKNNCTIVNYE